MKNILIVILLFSLNTSVLAHSGRTDSKGGHNCSSKSKLKGLCTGYHYHSSLPNVIKEQDDDFRKRVFKDIKPKNKRNNEVNQSEANIELLRLFLNAKKKHFEEFNKLYSSVEETLTKLICEGESKLITRVYNEIISEENNGPTTSYISFNENYLFSLISTSPNQWLLVGEKKNDQWINPFPSRSQLHFNDSSMGWGMSLYNFPLGKKDISKLLGMNTDWVMYLESVVEGFSINRINGNFYSELKMAVFYPNEEMDNFDTRSQVNGKCSIITKKMF